MNYEIEEVTLHRGYSQHSIENLEYAYTDYSILISYRVAKAIRPEMQWSENTTITVTTEKQIPSHPPKTFENAFELLPNNRVYIYWQPLDRGKWNGDELKYEIIQLHTHATIIEQPPTTRHSATVYDIFANEFRIYSANELGRSTNYSVIKIKNEEERIPFARRMVKFVENGLYTLKWHLPENSTNYLSTIIICEQIDDQQSVCQVKLIVLNCILILYFN